MRSKETHRRILPNVYLGTNSAGWLLLVKLPLGYGLNFGTGFSGLSVRPWDWARYDYADHFTYLNQGRWMRYPQGVANA
jgi:hypothetical protein